MLPFSPGPVPTTDAELSARLADGLAQLLRPRQAERVQVRGHGATAEHITEVTIDLSGADLDPAPSEIPATGGTPVTVDRVAVDGDPVTVRQVRARVRAELRRLPAAWITDGAGLLWLVPQDATPVPASGADGVQGEVEVSARVSDLEQALVTIGAPLLAERGLTLTGVRLHIETVGQSTARVHVQAQVRRGILSATVDGRGTAAVDAGLVLTLSDLSASSGNPLVSMGLTGLTRRLQAWQGRRIDLGGRLVGGLRLRQVVARSSGGDVALSARVGQ